MNFHLVEVLKQAARKIKPQKEMAGVFMNAKDKLKALLLLVCSGYTVRALCCRLTLFSNSFSFISITRWQPNNRNWEHVGGENKKEKKKIIKKMEKKIIIGSISRRMMLSCILYF